MQGAYRACTLKVAESTWVLLLGTLGFWAPGMWGHGAAFWRFQGLDLG